MTEYEEITVETLQALVASMKQQHETQMAVAQALTKLVNATGEHTMEEVLAKIEHLRGGIKLGLMGLMLVMKIALPVKHPIHGELQRLFQHYLSPEGTHADS